MNAKSGTIRKLALAAGVIAVSTLGALVLAGMAGATKPLMVREEQGPFTLDAGSFPVLFQPTAPDISKAAQEHGAAGYGNVQMQRLSQRSALNPFGKAAQEHGAAGYGNVQMSD